MALTYRGHFLYEEKTVNKATGNFGVKICSTTLTKADGRPIRYRSYDTAMADIRNRTQRRSRKHGR